jgi:hypothetical protein
VADSARCYSFGANPFPRRPLPDAVVKKSRHKYQYVPLPITACVKNISCQ